ncbi:MAG: DUF5947 family protein [Euzebya sp.]
MAVGPDSIGDLSPLAQILQRKAPPAGQQCDMCATPIGEPHSHVVDLENRGLRCTCRPCALLFSPDGASQGRFKLVPTRISHDPHFDLTAVQWDSVQIPVGMAFLFHNTEMERTVAFYPSPAGATESLLNLEAWDEVTVANPAFADLEADVEALLLHRLDDGSFEAFGVPIDICYELVGVVRSHWKGFDGGSEAHKRLDEFFSDLRQRGRTIGHGAATEDATHHE